MVVATIRYLVDCTFTIPMSNVNFNNKFINYFEGEGISQCQHDYTSLCCKLVNEGGDQKFSKSSQRR